MTLLSADSLGCASSLWHQPRHRQKDRSRGILWERGEGEEGRVMGEVRHLGVWCPSYFGRYLQKRKHLSDIRSRVSDWLQIAPEKLAKLLPL